MKNKILLFLILLSSISFAQVSNGGEQEFDYGIKNNASTEIYTPPFLVSQGIDGTYGKMNRNNVIEYLEFASAVNLPVTGEQGKLYLTKDNNKIYRWNGTYYAELAITDISGKVDKVTGKSLLSDTEITRLATLSNYTHPANHPPSIITQDASNRFVTDAEKTAWNAKQGALGFTPENVANKATTLTASTTLYPNNDAVIAGLATKEDNANKVTSIGSSANDTNYPSELAVKTYADNLVVGMLNDRGTWDASINAFPTTGGSGVGGAIRKGDMWYVSVAGTLGTKSVNVGDSFRALVNAPAQVAANWSILEANIGYVPANDSNVVHLAGAETITGVKSFTPIVSATANLARGTIVNPTLTATANNDELVGLDILPTFNSGGFTNTSFKFLRIGDYAYFGSDSNSIRGRGYLSLQNNLDNNGSGLFLRSGNSLEHAGLFQLDGSGNVVFRTSQGGMYFDNFGSTSGLYFRTNGSNIRMFINNAGRVLLGTTTDDGINRLQISGTASSGTTALGNTPPTANNQLTRKDYVDSGLALKANLASPALTGTPTAPTATAGTNTTQIATTAFVTSAISTADSGNVKLTGNQTITGQKTFNNSTLVAGVVANNTSTGTGLAVVNSSAGVGIYSNNQSAGNGFHSDNSSTGISIYSTNSQSGNGIVSNQGPSGTGFNYVGQSNGTNTYTVDKLGAVTATSFVNSTAPATNVLLAGGTTLAQNTAFNKNFGTTAGTVVEGNDSRLSDSRTPTAGSNSYIQNQNASAQSANMWISGIGQFTTRIKFNNVNQLLGDGSMFTGDVNDFGIRNDIGNIVLSAGGATPQFTLSPTGAATFSSTVTASNGTLIGGTLTSGRIPKATGANSLGNSSIYEDGGNVGIGTTTPKSRVQLGYTYPNLLNFNTDGENMIGSNMYYSGGEFKRVLGSNATGITFRDGSFYFRTSDGGVSDSSIVWADVMQLKATGNLLINTTTDNGVDKLQVNGSGLFNGNLQINNLSGSGTRNVVADASGNLSTDSTVYAPLSSPALTGTPTAPTAPAGTNTTQIATTAFVNQAIRPCKVYTALLSQSGTNAPLSSPALTGTPTAPTAPAGTNTTQIATTAFVNQAIRPYKVYTALLSQSGTNAPIATVLENTLGGTVVWSRTDTGIYQGTLTGAFTTNKTHTTCTSGVFSHFTQFSTSSADTVNMNTTNKAAALTDGLLNGDSIEIRVYL